jgi:hypothetical protein
MMLCFWMYKYIFYISDETCYFVCLEGLMIILLYSCFCIMTSVLSLSAFVITNCCYAVYFWMSFRVLHCLAIVVF